MDRNKIPIGFAISGVKGFSILREALSNPEINIKIVFQNKILNISYNEIKELCKKNRIKCIETTRIENYKNIISKNNIKLLFVIGWRFKIHAEVYNLLDKGIIVFHDSLLPKYRGFSPLYWAIINGEKITGTTAFFIDENIDTGDIIYQKKIQINSSDDINILTRKVIDSYKYIFRKIIWLLKENKYLPRRVQNHRAATYCIWRIPEDARIDWKNNAEDIYNLIRASKEPFYPAYTLFQGKKLYILEAMVTRYRKYVGITPGKVENIEIGDGVCILAKDGLIKIKKVRLEGDEGEKSAWDVINKLNLILQ